MKVRRRKEVCDREVIEEGGSRRGEGAHLPSGENRGKRGVSRDRAELTYWPCWVMYNSLAVIAYLLPGRSELQMDVRASNEFRP